MVRAKEPLSYWQGLSTQKLLEGYALPHVRKCMDEGHYVRAFVLEELARRLEALDPPEKI